ncbi:MAG TPA: PAS domain S-box protein [Anaerolineae bacterium]|nr:PAS domain S-box protein [Anaerolineae bacterium]
MKELAAAFRVQFDALLLEYEQRLQKHSDYAALPPQARMGIARRILGGVMEWLESDDDSGLLGFIRTMAQERTAHGRDIGGMQYAVMALDELLSPLLQDIATAKQTWRTFFKVQELISHFTVERLYASENRLHQMMDRLPAGIFQATFEGTLLDANPAFFKIVGYPSLADVNQVGMAGLSANPGDWAQLLAQVAQGPIVQYEIGFNHAAGRIIWVMLSAWSVQLQNEPPYLEGILEDVTERRLAEEVRREAEERFRAIYEGSNDALMLLRPAGFFDCNQRTLELFKCATKAVFITKKPAELSPPTQPNGADSETAALAYINLAYAQGYARFEWVHRRQDGVDFPAEVLLSAFELRGERVLQATVRDITRRKRAEQALRDSEVQIRELLARRERQVQTSIEIAQDIASAPELEELLRRVVTLVKERFSYYHAQIFRYDPTQDVMVLVVGYGEAGRQMLALGHKLPMGQGVVGTAAATGRAILVSDSGQDKDWQPNPLLPETKGELASPIKLRDQVLGILDVQSDQAGALTTEDQLLLDGLCGQIAIAMESTRLVEELRLSQEELSDAMRIAHLGYWQFNPTTGIFTFNDQFYNIFHSTAEREGGYQMTVAQYAERFLYPDDAGVVAEETERALRATDRHYTRTIEHRILYTDGGIGYLNVHIHIDRDENGNILHYYGVNEDITERKLAEIRIQETLQELERLYRATTREGWQVFRETGQLAPGYRFDGAQVQPTADLWAPQIAQAVQQSALVSPTAEAPIAAAPLTVRGEVIGTLGVWDDPERPLSADELALLQELGEQGSLALESARLYQDTQRRAAREQLVGEVTSRIRETLDLNTVLQTAVREMGLATGADVVEVRLRTGLKSEEPS